MQINFKTEFEPHKWNLYILTLMQYSEIQYWSHFLGHIKLHKNQ